MKKILPYILILVIAIGFFAVLNTSVKAQTTTLPPCVFDARGNLTPPNQVPGTTCGSVSLPQNIPTPTQDKKGVDLYSRLPACGVTSSDGWSGCILTTVYWLIYALPAGILTVVGFLFNAMLSLTLSTKLYNNNFIPEAWRVVRDFSNIFFILILLYVAIKMILGLGGAEVKKMVAQVVVMALLINFSMFFTKVVIDASNILALIFYNKIEIKVDGKSTNYKPTLDETKTGVKEKDFSGGIVGSFEPTALISDKMFKAQEKSQLNLASIALKATMAVATSGVSLLFESGSVNIGMYLLVIFISAAIFLFASYALFIASIAFMGRLIELWLCIIFSPFAFMSLTVPKLKGIDYLGWDAWLKRLLAVAFMAPTFMFFLLLISKIIQAEVFKDMASADLGFGGAVMLIVIPAIIYLSLLWKATEFAKKGGGEFAQAFIKYGQMGAAVVGGLAIGAASGGVGLAASATLGRAGASLASSGALKAAEARGGLGGFAAGKLRDLGGFAGKSSFDIRKAPGVGSLLKSAGIKTESSALTKSLGMQTEGGYIENRKRRDEKRRKRAEELKVGEDEELSREMRRVEGQHQDLLVQNGNAHNIEQIDKRISVLSGRAATAARDVRTFGATTINTSTGRTYEQDAQLAANLQKNVEGERAAIKNASAHFTSDGRFIDQSTNTTDGNFSDEAIDAIVRAARAAEAAATAAAAAAPGSAHAIEAANTSAYADVIAKSAEASRAVSARDANPANPALATAATLALTDALSAATHFAARPGITPEQIAAANQAAANANNGAIGRSINNLEDTDIPHAHHELEHETKERQRTYADIIANPNRFQRLFTINPARDSMAAREVTAHKIRMGAKLDSGSGGKGGGH